MATKAEVIDRVAESVDMSKAQAARAVDALHDIITDILVTGDTVTFVGFGTYASSERAAREGRNPQTGATMQIAATTVAKFKAGKKLKEALNKD
ncbi:MAG: HU family DNA-binding protein [Coxiellaceae bacterium]|nr:HU family DNA-binding protein [Coxiellaceae bacterium]